MNARPRPTVLLKHLCRALLLSVLSTATCLAAEISAATTPEDARAVNANKPQPNFIVILADDLGYGDLGVYGSLHIKTPQLDKLAAQGARFEQFYSASPVCSPARAALLTGRYPIRMGIHKVFYPESLQGMDPEEITIAEVLREQGYRSGLIGKWHLGHHAAYMPWNQGFDEFFGLPYSNDMGGLYYHRNQQVLFDEIDQRYLTKTYTREALQFIDAHQQQPFFLLLSHNMPHVPLYASPDFEGRSEGGLYGDTVEELDWSVGQIVARLQELGIAENTLLLFTSDNGPWRLFGESGGSSGPLRGGKRYTFEGGMRVPGIAYWPGTIPAGSIINTVSSQLDLLPTLAALAKAPLPQDVTLDGRDISPLLQGEQMATHPLFYYMNGELRAYRNGPWKIKKPFKGELGILRWLHPGFVPGHGPLLFNLAEDPGETTNLYAQEAERYQQMLVEMQQFEASLGELPDAKLTGKNTDFSPYVSLLTTLAGKLLLTLVATLILVWLLLRALWRRFV